MRFLFLWTLLTLVSVTSGLGMRVKLPQTSFSFSQFDHDDEDYLTFGNQARIGNTTFRNNVVELTPNADTYKNTRKNLRADIKGSVFYNKEIHLVNKTTTASFSTTFAFVMKPVYPSNTGDGLAFIITSKPGGHADAVGNFGFFHHGHKKHATLAVEFDTLKNHELFDIDENHVGVDIDDPISKVAVSAHSVGINLNFGRPITAWIDYIAPHGVLEVRISVGLINRSRPEQPLIEVPLDLSNLLKDNMWIGFSAGTHYGYNQLHYIYSWSFTCDQIVPGHKHLSRTGKIVLIVVLCLSIPLLLLLSICCWCYPGESSSSEFVQERKSWGKTLADMVFEKDETVDLNEDINKAHKFDEERQYPGVMANCLPFQNQKYFGEDEEQKQVEEQSQGWLPRMLHTPNGESSTDLQEDDQIMYSNSTYNSENDENDIIPVYPYDTYPDERIDSIAYNKPRQYKQPNPTSKSPPRSRAPSPQRRRGN